MISYYYYNSSLLPFFSSLSFSFFTSFTLLYLMFILCSWQSNDYIYIQMNRRFKLLTHNTHFELGFNVDIYFEYLIKKTEPTNSNFITSSYITGGARNDLNNTTRTKQTNWWNEKKKQAKKRGKRKAKEKNSPLK